MTGPRGRSLAGSLSGTFTYAWYSERVIDGQWKDGGEGGTPSGSEVELQLFQANVRRTPADTYAIVKKNGETVWVFGTQSVHTPEKWRQGAGGVPGRKWVVPVLAVAGGLLLLYLLSD